MDEQTDPDRMHVTVRPMRVDDTALHHEFIARLEPGDLRFRFGDRISEVPRSRLPVKTRVDHETETTFVATIRTVTGNCAIAGEVRIQEDVDGTRAEFAIAVRSDLQRQRLGRILLERAIAFCRERRLRLLYGLVDPSNTGMIALARRLDFDIDEVPNGATVVVSLDLHSAAGSSAKPR
jgi:acetyltransferase